jgi:hypothetical protein
VEPCLAYDRQRAIITEYLVFWTIALALGLLASMSIAHAQDSAVELATVEDIRVGLVPGRSRVVFDLSGPTAYESQFNEEQAQVVITLHGALPTEKIKQLPFGGTPISQVETQTTDDSTQRIIFSISRQVTNHVFQLGPHNDRGHRIVLDLYDIADVEEDPGETTAPSETMILATTDPDTAPRKNKSLVNPQNEGPASDDTRSEWSGYLSLETRQFFDDPAYPNQDRNSVSFAIQPEYYYDWAGGRQRFAFTPFFRYDANDDERTHADIRELYWRIEWQSFLLKTGIDVVFWGVTESQHLVDIINQTDLVENIDGEEKLGQPMIELDYMSDWGTWQLYVLPYFRERTFPGENGRLRTDPFVDTDFAIYESSQEENHTDLSLRWSHYIGDWDIGLAHFSGTSREPLLVPSETGDSLLPVYLQIDQTSLDMQATKGAWLWKLEALYNQNEIDNYYAFVGGLEYTYFGIGDTVIDLGLLMEYNYDDRGEQATTLYQNDIYLGLRLTGNDVASTQILAGLLVDADTQSTVFSIEAVRRIGEDWTIGLESRLFGNTEVGRPLHFLRNDDYLEIQFSRFF